MRKIIVNTFITLDGVMQAPGGPEEDPTGGFEYGGWSVNYWDEMMEHKKQDGPEIQVHGSGNLIQTLLKNDLIDEFRVWTFPLTIGTGKRLFGEGTIPVGLKLLDCKISTTGVSIATYKGSGKIKTGSFALENPTEAELIRRKRLE